MQINILLTRYLIIANCIPDIVDNARDKRFLIISAEEALPVCILLNGFKVCGDCLKFTVKL